MSDTMHALHVTQLGNRVVVLDCRARRVATATVSREAPNERRARRSDRRATQRPLRVTGPAA